MTRARILILLVVAFLIVILGTGAGVWWYLFGANNVDAAELVPTDTIFFATIPNAANIGIAYQTSQLKQIVDSPNFKPLSDSVTTTIGQKNLDLLNSFLPNLSGQSFFAVTHFDSDKPAEIGIIAGLKPKAGMGSFDAFIAQLKTTWPEVTKQGQTGTGNVAGVDYQWIKGPGATDKICVAQVSGWIITTWGEATLQDWIERFHKKSATFSLAQNDDYKKSISRVGQAPMALVYVNYHTVIDLLQKQMLKTNPTGGDYLFKKFGAIGGMAIGTKFENGEIVDRFSYLMPKQAQLDAGMSAAPCAFETLKFTGPATRLYWGASVDWQQYAKNVQEQTGPNGLPNPLLSAIAPSLKTWAQLMGVDLQHNIIDALGNEFSLQMEWSDDQTYPDVGLFVKVAKPDDFKPVITALIESVRKAYISSAIITELTANGQTFSALKFIQPSLVTPTVTETGPYFGLFSSEKMAVNSYSREELAELPHNADFTRQIGDKRNGAAQLMFVDTPHLLDRTYRTALPYLSLASMFNKNVAAWLQGKNLPPDLTWLAPMGTWSFVLTPDDDGVQGYSVSGIGNQGILMAFGVGGAIGFAQTAGILPKMTNILRPPAPAYSPPPPTPAPAPMTPAPSPTNATTPSASPTTPAPDTTTNAASPAAPATDTTTNAATSTTPAPATNAAPSAPDIVPPPPATNTESSPATNSAVSPPAPAPDATKSQ